MFFDRNADGLRETDELGVPGVVVAIDRGGFVTTNAHGEFFIDAPTPGSIAWARPTAGFRPGPAWARADVESPEIALVPLDFITRSSRAWISTSCRCSRPSMIWVDAVP